MTRRTLIATLLAAILAPFRRAKAARGWQTDLCMNELSRHEITADACRRWAYPVERVRAHYVFGTGELPPGAEFTSVPRVWTKRLTPTAAKFGLCAKCGGLTCVCD